MSFHIFSVKNKRHLEIFSFQHGKKDVVRALLQEGADPCVFDTNQKTAIDIAQNKEMQQVFAGVLLQAIAVDRYYLRRSVVLYLTPLRTSTIKHTNP